MQMSESLIKESDTLRVLINQYIEKNNLFI
jgi:hypothetical protein